MLFIGRQWLKAFHWTSGLKRLRKISSKLWPVPMVVNAWIKRLKKKPFWGSSKFPWSPIEQMNAREAFHWSSMAQKTQEKIFRVSGKFQWSSMQKINVIYTSSGRQFFKSMRGKLFYVIDGSKDPGKTHLETWSLLSSRQWNKRSLDSLSSGHQSFKNMREKLFNAFNGSKNSGKHILRLDHFAVVANVANDCELSLPAVANEWNEREKLWSRRSW